MRNLILAVILALPLLLSPLTTAQATEYAIAAGGSGSGSISETNQEDWWAVTVSADGELTLTVTQDRDGDLLEINLYDTDGTTWLTQSHSSGSVETVSVPNLAPGTYYLLVYRYGSGTCTYSLQSQFTPNPYANDPEPNDTIVQAVSLEPNATRTGHIGYTAGGVSDIYDYYKVTVPTDGELALSVTQNREGDIIDTYLYDTDGTKELARGYTHNTTEVTTLPNLKPGTYYLLVYRYSEYCGYELKSQFTPNPLANDPEPNDTIAQAVPVDPNATRTGHIGYYAGGVADRYDYYKVNVPADGELSLSVTQDRDGDILDTILYDTDGVTELARGYTHNTTEVTTVPNLKPGTYYLRIESYVGGFCGYTLQSRFTPQPLATDAEPNDTLQTAQTVRQDRPVTGHLGYYSAGVTDRDDWFRYVLPADGDFWLTIVTDATLDADVVLYDATGSEIVRDSGSSTSSRVGKDGLKAGVYYLKIYSYWTGYGGYTVTPGYTPFYVNLLGMGQIIPGEEVTFLLRYANPLTTPLENAVVMIDMPLNIDIRGSTGGGIYRADDACRNQLFWKLGTLDPGAGGEVTFTFSVPWGTPFADMKFSGFMSASNMTDPPFDVTPYLNYLPNRVTGEKNLSAGEVTALLATQPALAALYNLMTQEGYLFFGTAVHYSRQDAAEMDRLYLVAPGDAAPTVLTWSGGTAFAEVFRKGAYSVFDTAGGFTWDRSAQTFVPWGSWAAASSPAARAAARALAITGLREAHCQFNCTINSIPDMAAEKVSSVYETLNFSKDCITCAASIKDGSPDAESCEKCTANGAGKLSTKIASNVPLLGDAVSWSWAVKKCFDDCQNNPNAHICTEDKKECNWSIIGWMGGFDTVYTTPCNKTTGTYGLASYRTYCAYGDACVNGTCGPRPACTGSTCQEKTEKVRSGHDPNAKSVDHKGDVIPAQRLNYTLEYENTGSGAALGVFLMDRLDPNLDETSLSINNGGSYSAATRMLSWDVGDLPAGGKGSVSFGVNLKGTTAGTEVVNQAKVYFPSALEVTPTNAVVNRLAALTADPVSMTGMSRAAIPVSLSGQSSSGMAVSYRIVTYPAQGTLTGAAPHLTYTSAPKFSGQDEFTYVTFLGAMESAPARVTVTVTPDPADSSPPTVTGTVPAAGATGVHVSTDPVSTAPDLYLPAVRATFSEAMESATITADSFTVDGISGTVTYDAATRTATFQPGAPLGTLATYTARLTSAIRNLNGTPLAPFSWQFSTESPARLAIGLPLGVSELLYPDLSVSQVSSPRTVTVTSSGSQNLLLGTVSVGGTGAANFAISEDLCSGRTLGQGESCSVTVTFAPQAAGDHQAGLTLPSNDAASPTATVPLKGSAIALCTLTLTATGSGSGTLLGAGGYVCGQTVPVTVTATSGSGFIGWSGDCSGTTAGISVPMDRNRSCTATFGLIRGLTLELLGSGGGSVSSTPPGFYCQTGSCWANYYQEESVRLTAAPDRDSLFAGWGGDCRGTGSCLLDFLGDRQVTASFTFVKPVRLLVTGIPDAEYGTLQEACAAAPSGSAIKARSYTFTGTVTLGTGSAVTFSGGYERDFATRTGSSFSLLKGVLIIGKGSLQIDRLVIQ